MIRPGDVAGCSFILLGDKISNPGSYVGRFYFRYEIQVHVRGEVLSERRLYAYEVIDSLRDLLEALGVREEIDEAAVSEALLICEREWTERRPSQTHGTLNAKPEKGG